LDLEPEEAHALGHRELERLRAELEDALERKGHPGSLSDALQSWAAGQRFSPGDDGRSEALAITREASEAARLGVRYAFNLWPDASVEIEAIDPEAEASQHSYYVPPAAARAGFARGPGKFWINLALTVAQPRAEAIVLAFHEGWPGHHLQLSIAQQADLPPLRRALLFNAYLEGWAKYAESLPEHLGVTDDPDTRIARLRTELYSTATLTLDTGVHMLGWSEDRARKFFVEQTGAGRELAGMVVLRSAANPAQLCAYKLGLLTVRSLSDQYRRTRGRAHRLADFHDAVLGAGALPLAVLERSVVARASQESNR
jgi:uncharacterized protein (DUF885 family)